MWYKAHYQLPDFKLCKPIFWDFSKRFCLTTKQVREAQTKQFEIDTATAEALYSNGGSVKKPAISLVQVEDEHGNVETAADDPRASQSSDSFLGTTEPYKCRMKHKHIRS